MDQPKKEVKELTAQDFASKYQALCEEMGYRIYGNPVWIARDDGTFSMQVQLTIGKLPKKEVDNGSI